MSAKPGRWKYRTMKHEGPLPHVAPALEEMLDAWADIAPGQAMYRMTVVDGDEARLLTAELIPLMDKWGAHYLQLIRNWNVWVNLEDPNDPEGGGHLHEFGPVRYREVMYYDAGTYDPRNVDTTREFLDDHPAPLNPEDYFLSDSYF